MRGSRCKFGNLGASGVRLFGICAGFIGDGFSGDGFPWDGPVF